jgi:hypothetical protein
MTNGQWAAVFTDSRAGVYIYMGYGLWAMGLGDIISFFFHSQVASSNWNH